MAQIRWDTRQVADRLEKLDGHVRRLLKNAALQVGNEEVLEDAVNEVPTVPLRAGWLRGTAESDAEVHGAIVELEVGFNSPYGAVMHEGRWETGRLAGIEVKHWTTPGSGKHFLSSKLQRHGQEYVERFSGIIVEKTGMD